MGEGGCVEGKGERRQLSCSRASPQQPVRSAGGESGLKETETGGESGLKETDWRRECSEGDRLEERVFC